MTYIQVKIVENFLKQNNNYFVAIHCLVTPQTIPHVVSANRSEAV